MSHYCVVVAEGSRARFFTVEPPELPELQSGPDLIERKTMNNPDHQSHGEDLLADVRSGRNRPANGPGHGYDDHRDQYDAECERRFAREIAQELDTMTRRNGTRRVVLCAEKRMLGFLRPTLQHAIPKGVDLHEVPKDLAKLSPRKLHERLASDGHIPRRRNRQSH
ncbi:host attachment protein [Aquisalimonas sp.]|uniref:host attachment protein n=1 Tax=Aquisalimonas sp. TaxID=1872621 RepID=UPI0025C54796|nr:host attachment protein [Aquisalimonas sp.]